MSSQVLYRMYDTASDLLYVGISLDVAQRFAAHRCSKPWWDDIASITLAHFDTREEVEIAEANAIRSERPRYNIATPSRGLPLPVDIEELRAWAREEGPDAAELVEATIKRKQAVAEMEEVRGELRQALLEAHRSGSKQKHLCEITGYTRENVRRMIRQAEVEEAEQRAARA